MKIASVTSGAGIALLALLSLAGCGDSAEPTYVPRSAELRALPLYFYRARNSPDGPRAIVFFLGNDIGFWRPHRQLALAMAGQGYDVVGFDVKPLLASLPGDPARREAAFADRIGAVIAASRRELGAETIPLIVGGHSLGAEVAIWTAANVPIAGLAGVIALSPGSRSHLGVDASDIANGAEPSGSGSFSVADEVRRLPGGVRFALIRGEHDRYRFADSALIAAGGTRAQRYLVRFAGHSLKRIIVARPVVRRALDWLVPRWSRPERQRLAPASLARRA